MFIVLPSTDVIDTTGIIFVSKIYKDNDDYAFDVHVIKEGVHAVLKMTHSYYESASKDRVAITDSL